MYFVVCLYFFEIEKFKKKKIKKKLRYLQTLKNIYVFTSNFNRINNEQDEPMVVLVTGGSGLVGKAIERIIKEEKSRPNEKWVFLGSKDGDLRYLLLLLL